MSRELPGIVSAYRFDQRGVARRLADDEVADALDRLQADGDDWCWIHLNLADQRAKHWIERASSLVAEARDVLLIDDPHPRLELVDDTLIGVLTDLHHESVPEDEQHLSHEELSFGRLFFAMTPRLLVSGRRHPLHSVEQVRRHLSLNQLKPDEPIDLVEKMVVRFARLTELVLGRMAEALDDIEDQVLDDDPHDERRRLAPMRRTAVAMRRQLAPMKTMFEKFAQEEIDDSRADVDEEDDAAVDARERRIDFETSLRAAAARLAQRLDGLAHDIEAIQERARLLSDQIAMDMAEQTNRHLYLLSIMSALLLPPTLIAGVFGMNTSSLPWTDGDGGSWWAIGLAAATSVAAFIALVRIGVARRRS
ncbi:MAG: CorA family divalent cation transporter [Burkholderiaceae bacterium]